MPFQRIQLNVFTIYVFQIITRDAQIIWLVCQVWDNVYFQTAFFIKGHFRLEEICTCVSSKLFAKRLHFFPMTYSHGNKSNASGTCQIISICSNYDQYVGNENIIVFQTSWIEWSMKSMYHSLTLHFSSCNSYNSQPEHGEGKCGMADIIHITQSVSTTK